MTEELETEEDFRDRLQSYLTRRFYFLQGLRDGLDKDISQEIDAYNGKDAQIDAMPSYTTKIKLPTVYSQVQTIKARMNRNLFEGDNYMKVFMEGKEFKKIQREVTMWAQAEMDKLKLKDRATDFLEQALVSRTSWILLRPINEKIPQDNGKVDTKFHIEYDIHPWRDVWFDTKARDVMSTDFFIKKISPMWKIFQHRDKYFNLENVHPTENAFSGEPGQRNSVDLQQDNYRGQNFSTGSETGPSYNEQEGQSQGTGMDEVEIHEYYGLFDFSPLQPSDPDYQPDMREIVATMTNKNNLIRYQEVTMPLRRSRLIFPIRPIRQASSLVGKSIPQLTKDQQHQLNLAESFRMQNLKNLVKLLFKYNKNSDINLEEIFNGDGNAIGWDEGPDDIQIFDQKNLLSETTLLIRDINQSIQATTGAVDAVSGGANVPDTARGQMALAQEANFKFQMMTENVYNDIRDFINYALILLIEYNSPKILLRWPEIGAFLDQDIADLEDNYYFDINLRDASTRRDLEQSQWANMIGIVGPLIQQNGGNMNELIKRLLTIFGMNDPEAVLEPESPDQIVAKLENNPQLKAEVFQIIQQLAAQKEGGAPAGPGGSPAPVQASEAADAQNIQELS